MTALYDIPTLKDLIDTYTQKGGEVFRLGDESLGLGTVILAAPEGTNLYNFIIKEIYLNEWSSGHTLRRYRKLPKKYEEIIKEIDR